MDWLLCAFLFALRNVFLKKVLAENNVLVISFGLYLISFIILSPLLAIINVPELDKTFWIAVIILLPLETAAILLYLKAIKISPLSSCVPFTALTPLFLILTAFLILKELPDKSGIIGIFLVVFGAYSLNIHKSKSGWLGPIKSILEEKGSLLMILVAFIFSLTSILGKIAINHSDFIFFSIFYFILLTPVLFLLSLITAKSNFHQILKNKKFIFLGGLCFAISLLLHNLAITMTIVPYFISIKRTSIIFNVILGAIIFKEKNIREKLLGSIIMIIGIMFISLL